MPSLPKVEQFACYNWVKLLRERRVRLEKDFCPGLTRPWNCVPLASITKYYLRDILNRTRIIAADKVVKIDKEIIFVDDKEKLGNIIPEIQIA